jgi:4-alpha-glucanotransferase
MAEYGIKGIPLYLIFVYMKIFFYIDYQTRWGESLFISLTTDKAPEQESPQTIALQYHESGRWEALLELPIDTAQLCYSYFLRHDDGLRHSESGPPRRLFLHPHSQQLFLHDQWQGNTHYAPFLSIPFTEVFYARPRMPEQACHSHPRELILRVCHPNLPKDSRLFLSGSSRELGAWDPAKALALHPIYAATWEIRLPLGTRPTQFAYKFLLKPSLSHPTFVWEDGMNRHIDIPALPPHSTYLQEHSLLQLPIKQARFAGTAIPVFSLRSRSSCGIGDFADLRLMIDWAAQTGQQLIQVLPVHDTTMSHTALDSYPYAAISVMALHPLYLSTHELGLLKNKSSLEKWEAQRLRLNLLPQLDYAAVDKHKWAYFKAIYKQNGAEILASPACQDFLQQNQSWLLPYAAFCVLRERYQTADFSQWLQHSVYQESELSNFYKQEQEALGIHLYLQYQLHCQLVRTRNYAHSKGVVLKGDIPIGIHRHSVEAWAEPHYFNMDGQAGAPPDSFATDGQNWGFPTYHWECMAKDDYAWWKRRLQQMSLYFDVYRIDHILGFFRIWEIPCGQSSGLLGYFRPALPLGAAELQQHGFPFDATRHTRPPGDPQALDCLFIEQPPQSGCYHPRIAAQNTPSYEALSPSEQQTYNQIYTHFFYERHNALWEAQAYRKLSELLSASGMLACAEDLGMIPHCVPPCLRELHLLSLEIERMPKQAGPDFAQPLRYPYLSVCTTGTHDTSTLRAWWEEDYELSSRYYAQVLHEKGLAPYTCEPWLCERILQHQLSSPSMLAIFPLQDWLAISDVLKQEPPKEERINIPAQPKHYWRYRMHIYIEDLLVQERLNQKISEMIEEALRNAPQ